jgi:hypothetical protein
MENTSLMLRDTFKIMDIVVFSNIFLFRGINISPYPFLWDIALFQHILDM